MLFIHCYYTLQTSPAGCAPRGFCLHCCNGLKDIHSHAKRHVPVALHSWRQGDSVYEGLYLFTGPRETKRAKGLSKAPVTLHLLLSQWWLWPGKLEPRNSMASLLWLLMCGTVDERLEGVGSDAIWNHSGVIAGLSMKMEEGWMFVKMRG